MAQLNALCRLRKFLSFKAPSQRKTDDGAAMINDYIVKNMLKI